MTTADGRRIASPPSRLAYFLGFYPTYVHTEVEEMRRKGYQVYLFFCNAKEEILQSGWVKVLESEPFRTDEWTRYYPTSFRTPWHIARFLFLAGYFLLSRFSPTIGFLGFFMKRRSSYLNFGDICRTFLFAKHALKWKVEHIHAHFAWDNATMAMLVSRLLDVPFTVTVHANDIFKPTHEKIIEDLFVNASRLITISDYNRRYLVEQYGWLRSEDGVNVIHCGIDIQQFTECLRGKKERYLVVTGASGLVEKKGVTYLIKAAMILKDKGYSFKWLVAGGDQSKVRLNKFRTLVGDLGLSNCVEFRGMVNQREWQRLLGRTGVFVLPCIVADDGSRDGIPVSIMEAMAAGIPVVTTNISGIPELVEHRVSGLLVREKDPVELANAIAELFDDDILRARLAEEGRKRVEEGFRVSETAAKIVSVFHECAMQTPKAGNHT